MTTPELTALAPAKLNLALVVGPLRPDGKHEVVTLLQRLELADEISVRAAPEVRVEGFADDTIVHAALTAIRVRTGVAFAARIRKEVPVAAGLGGGSSDAAAALLLANRLLDAPLSDTELHGIATGLGSDVPFFLTEGPQLGGGDGSELAPHDVPQSFAVLLALPQGAVKPSTASVYRSFDDRAGADGFAQRRAALLGALARVEGPLDLAQLPPNDVASSPLASELRDLGAFRADVTGAGPAVYGLFSDGDDAALAACALEGRATTWVTWPRW